MTAIRSAVGSAFLAVASCAFGGVPPDLALLPVPGACVLLSRADVSEAVANPVREGIPQMVGRDVMSCSFVEERGARVALLLRRIPTGSWAYEQIARMNRGVELGSYREVRGIGDRSFLYGPQSGAGVLCIFQSGYYLQISFLGRAGDTRARAALESLAARALARLDRVTAAIYGQ